MKLVFIVVWGAFVAHVSSEYLLLELKDIQDANVNIVVSVNSLEPPADARDADNWDKNGKYNCKNGLKSNFCKTKTRKIPIKKDANVSAKKGIFITTNLI